MLSSPLLHQPSPPSPHDPWVHTNEAQGLLLAIHVFFLTGLLILCYRVAMAMRLPGYGH